MTIKTPTMAAGYSSHTTRRDFLKQSAVTAAAVAPLAAASMVWAAEEPVVATAKPDRKIKLGLIGCGGRGPWLVDLFQKHGGYEIHAVADYFGDLADKAGERFGVDKTRRFSGLAGHKRLLDSGVEAAVVVNVPRFHPEHGHAAIEAGCHVYAAKPVAIDVPAPSRCRPPASWRRRRNSVIWSITSCPPTRSTSRS